MTTDNIVGLDPRRAADSRTRSPLPNAPSSGSDATPPVGAQSIVPAAPCAPLTLVDRSATWRSPTAEAQRAPGDLRLPSPEFTERAVYRRISSRRRGARATLDDIRIRGHRVLQLSLTPAVPAPPECQGSPPLNPNNSRAGNPPPPCGTPFGQASRPTPTGSRTRARDDDRANLSADARARSPQLHFGRAGRHGQVLAAFIRVARIAPGGHRPSGTSGRRPGPGRCTRSSHAGRARCLARARQPSAWIQELPRQNRTRSSTVARAPNRSSPGGSRGEPQILIKEPWQPNGVRLLQRELRPPRPREQRSVHRLSRMYAICRAAVRLRLHVRSSHGRRQAARDEPLSQSCR